MRQELFVQAWEALHGEAPLPTDLETPLEALMLLFAQDVVELPTGHVFEISEDLFLDPWPEMLVSPQPERANRDWIFQAAQLLLIGRGPQGEMLALDMEGDSEGRHRVYQIGAGGRMAHLLFPDLDELLAWLCAPEVVPPRKPDRWAANVASIERSLELLWRLHPSVLFQSYRMGVWPSDRVDPPEVDPERPGWQRLALIWTLAQFREHRRTEVPPQLEGMELSSFYQDLLERLEDLEEAMLLDDVPTLLAEMALEDEEDLASAAQSWMEQFDRARTDPKGATAMLAEETKGLMGLLRQAVDELVRLELIEVIPQRKPKLVEDLLEVTLKTPNVNQVIPALIEELLESRNVEEVFADDNELTRVLSVALGMGGAG